ncbi:MAG: gliding motility-associated ABC transporter substrate-binding protein GldG [Crocinitomicaceae bacterium]|nr:gliding motility-associated ABC transporter substrate-binding protein GldG [Crocinitomicaceae bacterium]MBK8925981.1 gliding motility-associated ABC transporter substrate-binding protein GldG [Crocinitomicaceae bacterium]
MFVKKKNSSKSDLINFAALIGVIILLNYICSFFFGRFDFTEDKRHTLSPNTIALLQNEKRLQDRILFKIYLEGDLPADMMRIRNAVQEKLDEFIVYAGENIQYEFIDPNGDEDEDFNLQVQESIYDKGRGIIPCDMEIIESGKTEIKTVWPGAIIEYKGLTIDHVQFFKKRVILHNDDIRNLADVSINNLEYLLISAIRRVTDEEKKRIAFLQGQGELMPVQTADIRDGLMRYYEVKDVTINGQINALDEIDALIVASPTERFNERDKFVIDQFIMRGGKVLWFVDPVYVDRDSLYFTGETYGVASNLNIEKDMIYKYGVRLNTDLIIDKTCGPLYVPGHPTGIVDWYFYPNLERENHPITKNIDPIKSEYASSIDIVNEQEKSIKKTVLLKSSYNSRIFKARARVNYSIIDVEPKFNDGTQGDFPVAVLLEGIFPSAFENRLPDAFVNSADYQTRFRSDSTKMLVVADGDIIRNEVDSMLKDGQMRYYPIPLKTDVYGVMNQNGTPKYIYGNKEFVLNSVDYMLDDFSLIDVRTKTITLRMLDTARIIEEKEFWRMLNILLPLMLISLVGAGQFLIRKKRFATGF